MLDFKIYSGQLIRISLNDIVHMIGVCDGNSRGRNENPGTKIWTYSVAGINSILTNKNIETTYAEGSTFADVVEDLTKPELGLTSGYVDSNSVLDSDLVSDGKTIAEILDTLAEADGRQWWVNNDMELNFAENPETIEDAPYTLDKDFGSFTDYQNLDIEEDYTNYANWIRVSGGEHNGVTLRMVAINDEDYDEYLNICGYDSGTVYVVSDTNIILPPPDINIADSGTTTEFINDNFAAGTSPAELEEGDAVYNYTQDTLTFCTTISSQTSNNVQFYVSPPVASQASRDRLWYMKDFNETAKRLLRTKSGYPPLIVNFDTNTIGFLPKQRLYINHPDLEVIAYFNIIKVDINEIEAGVFNFHVEAEKKDYAGFNTITHRSYAKFFKTF